MKLASPLLKQTQDKPKSEPLALPEKIDSNVTGAILPTVNETSLHDTFEPKGIIDLPSKYIIYSLPEHSMPLGFMFRVSCPREAYLL